MTYNPSEHSRYLMTAGKVSIAAAVVSIAIFIVAFVFDAGTQELSRVSAQTATTTLTVLNTPPSFTVNAYEVVESSTTTPTNSGNVIQWAAIANDSNGAPYFLLICNTSATPTARFASSTNNLGTVPPVCSPTSTTQWGVSAATPSDALAVVSTTTSESAPFGQVNNWYAWVCDDDPFNARCNTVPVQGYSATNSSPFHVNFRPTLSGITNTGPVDPGGTLAFNSVSADPDTVGGEDNIILVVCEAQSYSTSTNNCATQDFIASTTINVLSNASATYTLASIVRDDVYEAYGYIVDQHGHEATANPIQSDFTVNNVAPVVLGGDIELNGLSDLNVNVERGQTTGFTLDFTVRDANSCVTAASTTDEISGYVVSVFRSSYGTTTCDGTSGSYNPNYCYPSGVPTTTWNLSCTASTTQCTSPLVDVLDFSCTFPLWYIADPTDSAPNTPASFASDNWSVGVRGIDNNAAQSVFATTTNPKELISFTALDLLTSQIPYGALEPGNDSGVLNATTTIEATGNTGLDQELRGESMCGTYTVSTECPVSATSTIPENQQKFSSTSLSYASILANVLSSSTFTEVELDVLKSTSTSTPSTGVTYWGIAVPGSITLAGNYQGLNTFMAVTAEAIDWTP